MESCLRLQGNIRKLGLALICTLLQYTYSHAQSSSHTLGMSWKKETFSFLFLFKAQSYPHSSCCVPGKWDIRLHLLVPQFGFPILQIILRGDSVSWGTTNKNALKALRPPIVLCKCLMIIIYSRASSLENSRSASFHNDLTDGLWYLIPLNPQSSLIVDVVKGQIRAHAALLLSPFLQYLCRIQLLPSLSVVHVNLLPAGTIRSKNRDQRTVHSSRRN